MLMSMKEKNVGTVGVIMDEKGAGTEHMFTKAAKSRTIITENDYEAVLDAESKTYTVTFDKHKLQVPQILSVVMELTEVTDIKLQETELAEIVKEIYNRGSIEKDNSNKTENGGN